MGKWVFQLMLFWGLGMICFGKDLVPCVIEISKEDLLDYRDKWPYGKSGCNPKSYQEFMKMLDSIKPDDNPVIRIVTLKN